MRGKSRRWRRAVAGVVAATALVVVAGCGGPHDANRPNQTGSGPPVPNNYTFSPKASPTATSSPEHVIG